MEDDDGCKIFNYGYFHNINFMDTGGYGIIYKATLFGKIVVLKKLKEDGNEADLHNEIKLLKKVGFHPNINSLFGTTEDPKTKNTIMVLNYANEGNLQSYIRKNWLKLTWRKKIKFALDIASGIEHLHKFKIIHRDLHPKNILVDNGVLKIADLGCSKILCENSLSNSNLCGIIAYIDPQCFISSRKKFKRNYKSDIYSFGMIMWFISTGRQPFEGSYQCTPKEILDGSREQDLSQKTPPEYIEIYKKSWDSDPEKRPQLIEIKKVLEILQKQIEQCCEYPYDSMEPKENLQIPQITKISDHTHYSYSTDSISNFSSTSNLHYSCDPPEPKVNPHIIITSNSISTEFDLVKEFRELIMDHKFIGSLKTEKAVQRFLEDYENEAPKIFNSLQVMRHERKDLFLALSYFYGFGIEKNVKKYLDNLENAFTKDVFAISELATCYRKGTGVEKDIEKAFELYKICVEYGSMVDKCSLSEFYLKGIGGARKDPKHAFDLLKSSATVGYIPAMYWLGYYYQYGFGVRQNLEKAADLYREVIQNGDYKDARKKLEELSNQGNSISKKSLGSLD
ncbi:41_t:CDS:2 [Acaulospora morrowiae]|uniref:41_t:CDS:1 n=1 Tax=Acaulospora morrowiae TaxID=94023 RepID=A0A9N9GN90_9GLOM|nr:41_t:CDS:2 [Acaulospora morrowiae]